MAQLNIIFGNLNKFYFEGEKLRMKLEVNVEKSCTLYNIMANFVGVSTYYGNDDKPNTMASKFFTKNPTEIYFDDVLPLFVAPNAEAAAWSTGIQSFTFEYQLPHTLPTSIEFGQGFVRYSVHIITDIDGEVTKKTEHFTVVSKTDLNKDVSAFMPGVLWQPENQCLFTSLMCRINIVRAFLHIAKKGYVPGECIFINAEVCNFNRHPIEWVKATLVQIIKLKGSNTVKEKRIVAEVARGCILPSETQTWRSENLLIPAVPPTTYPPQRLLRVKYRLLFQFKTSWQRRPTELKQKIVIGAVKLLEYGQGKQGQGEGEGVYNSEFFNGSNLEPCVFGPHAIQEEEKSSTFSPLYPIYVMMQ